jgi:ribonuclease HI
MLQFPIPAVPPGGHRLVVSAGDGAGAFEAAGYSDGSIKKARGTCAFVLKGVDGAVLVQDAQRLTEAVRDSNVPELRGILALLEAAARAGVRRLVGMCDSYQALQALAAGMAGKTTRYPEVAKILQLLQSFERIELRNIANRHNSVADALCARAHC